MKKLSVTIVMIALLFGFFGLESMNVNATNPLVSQDAVSSQTRVEGDWVGTIDVSVQKLRIILHLIKKGETLTATLDSPEQGATGLPIDSVKVVENELQFEMKALGAEFKGKFIKNGTEIEGTWYQMGQTLPLSFKRAESNESPEPVLKLQQVKVDGRGLNLLVGGNGTATVVFEGGFGTGIASWTSVQKEVAAFAQTVSYDRAGLGQSELGLKPRTAKKIAAELHSALQSAGLKPPYLLVGHSLGGLLVRVFADLYPKEVSGLILIDPSQEEFEAWTKKNPSPKAKLERDQMAKAAPGVKAEFEALGDMYSEARSAKVPSGIPVILLSATRDENATAEARKVWTEKHKEWIGKVPGGKLIIAESGHFIQLEEPGLVIDAIKQTLTRRN